MEHQERFGCVILAINVDWRQHSWRKVTSIGVFLHEYCFLSLFSSRPRITFFFTLFIFPISLWSAVVFEQAFRWRKDMDICWATTASFHRVDGCSNNRSGWCPENALTVADLFRYTRQRMSDGGCRRHAIAQHQISATLFSVASLLSEWMAPWLPRLRFVPSNRS